MPKTKDERGGEGTNVRYVFSLDYIKIIKRWKTNDCQGERKWQISECHCTNFSQVFGRISLTVTILLEGNILYASFAPDKNTARILLPSLAEV